MRKHKITIPAGIFHKGTQNRIRQNTDFFLSHVFAYSGIFYAMLLNNSLCGSGEGY